MRIAYIAPYHGPVIAQRRPVAMNRSLANATKLELIVGFLRRSGHEVEVLSQGEVDRSAFSYFRAASEALPTDPEVRVYYSSALPVRRISGAWSSFSTLRLLRKRHAVQPFDAVIVWNLKEPQLVCGMHALRQLRLPTILQYEDDMRVDMWGRAARRSALYRRLAPGFYREVTACIACSPHLLSQVPAHVPKLLLRGVIGQDLYQAAQSSLAVRRNWVLYSGTHDPQKGIRQLLTAWSLLQPADWELHITGEGPDTASLRALAATIPGVHFHGLVSRPDLVRLMSTARICANPHDLSAQPGNLFAFKIVEYLAGGAHVLTTPMGTLEPELEAGITYLNDNLPATIAAALSDIIQRGRWHLTAADRALTLYGPEAVTQSLNTLLGRAQVLTDVP